jgi:putative salt-induced outer membrane protein YdiY
MLLARTVFFIVLAVQQNNLSSDEVVKRDGTTLTGTLVSWNRAEIVFRTPDGQTHRLGPDQVARLSLGTGSIQATAATLPAPPPAPPPKRPEKTWKGAIDAGYAGNRGTTDSDSMVLDFQSERKTERFRLKLHSRYFYAIKNADLANNQVLGGGRLDRFFSPRVFVFGSGDFEFNEVEKIDLRSTYGAGFGYDVLTSEARRLSVSGGGGYTYENFSDGATRDSGSGLFTQEYRQRLWTGSELEQRFRLLQDLAQTARYRLRLDVGVRTKLSAYLGFRVGVSDAYDNRPRPNVRKNELSFTTGLGFTF